MEEKDKIIVMLTKQLNEKNEEIKEYQEELEKADSITQSCIFEGKEEATKSYIECLNLLERLQKENEILRHRLEVANEYIDDRKENMIIDHVIDLKYIINECDLDSTW